MQRLLKTQPAHALLPAYGLLLCTVIDAHIAYAAQLPSPLRRGSQQHRSKGALAVSVDTASIDLRELMVHGLVRAEGTIKDRRYRRRSDKP
jgi:hypothetical protein